ncbi:MAG: CoA-binding protein [Balneolales bacterium]|nr:CoA-binding protein [Balneolales bacterium]
MNSTFGSWFSKKMYATDELAAETDWIEKTLPGIKHIAIVGLSSNPSKDSHFVGRYLQKHGYKIYPVNPGADSILGVTSYKSLSDLPVKPDVVNVFIRPERVPDVVEQAWKTEAGIIWLQLGTGEHPELKDKTEALGRKLIQSRCIKVDHQFLIRDKLEASRLAR